MEVVPPLCRGEAFTGRRQEGSSDVTSNSFSYCPRSLVPLPPSYSSQERLDLAYGVKIIRKKRKFRDRGFEETEFSFRIWRLRQSVGQDTHVAEVSATTEMGQDGERRKIRYETGGTAGSRSRPPRTAWVSPGSPWKQHLPDHRRGRQVEA
ncbi:hypothetical protein E2C01_062981 [Portunus trituberculatus]|uniref:Uncharacterized protein n=1 Tax=Portunus trituberculatus TaxID=210409 RepID=A0A5B7HCI9_PORTR|nr:hypothetical protein [Portunus trituberculatus]